MRVRVQARASINFDTYYPRKHDHRNNDNSSKTYHIIIDVKAGDCITRLTYNAIRNTVPEYIRNYYLVGDIQYDTIEVLSLIEPTAADPVDVEKPVDAEKAKKRKPDE